MPKTRTLSALPSVSVSKRGAARLKAGHPWIYRSDVSAGNIPAGARVRVLDDRGKMLGTALYSSASQIAVRMISTAEVANWPELIRERVRNAVAYRKNLVADTNAYRLIFSEADFLPGLIVDRYNDLLSLQVLNQAMDTEESRQGFVLELRESLQPAAMIERVDPRVRELEQLPAREPGLLHGAKTATTFEMNGVKFHYAALEGQKTGAFLDQRENYAAAAAYAHGEALDVFCYQGGFALHLAPRCSQVAGVDSSRPALEIADRNATLNEREIEWIEGNAFDLLKDYAASGRRYDTIVLDPPAFAKSKRNLETARRGYKELNLRALKMLRPGGVLVTCSCSFHVSPAEFTGIVAEASQDARRTARILELRSQSRDHPILLNMPETAYLKCIVLAVS